MKKNNLILLITCITISLAGCKKPDPVGTDIKALQTQILKDFADQVAIPVYASLAQKAVDLYDAVILFNSTPTQDQLNVCRQLWRDARKIWENSEGFLIGPVATEDIDPRIDTWPVDYNDLNILLADTVTFTDSYIDNLPEALKGFHPAEYLLFGLNGNKTASSFTQREKEYLLALLKNLKQLTTELDGFWDSSITGGYYFQFTNAGNGSTLFPTQRAALLELASAMAGICDEVANGKMTEPFVNQDSMLEESPFSKNSILDFTHNIESVMFAYMGKYTLDGKGLEDFVKLYNLQLQSKILEKYNAAISALGAIQLPFGAAIYQEPQQVTNAIHAINDLKIVLETDLISFINNYVQ